MTCVVLFIIKRIVDIFIIYITALYDICAPFYCISPQKYWAGDLTLLGVLFHVILPQNHSKYNVYNG